MIYIDIKTRLSTLNDYDNLDDLIIETTFKHIPCCRDVCEYFFEEKYNKKFNETSWYLETDAKEFIKAIEDKWFLNLIDEAALYSKRDFKNFLISKYRSSINSLINNAILKEDLVPEDYYIENFDFE
jgi:hypothetical protein